SFLALMQKADLRARGLSPVEPRSQMRAAKRAGSTFAGDSGYSFATDKAGCSNRGRCSPAGLRTLERTRAMKPRLAAAAIALVWSMLALPTSAAEPARKTPLDDYIAKPDPTYSWKLVETVRGDGHTTFIVDLKSQTWRATPEVDRAVWQHWLV